MFEALQAQPPDKIFALMQAYREDPRESKIDLGEGVYKDASGLTPIMGAVKTAEQMSWEAQDTKVYTSFIGDPAFGDALRDLVLGSAVPAGAVAFAGTPGGTGACRQAFEFVKLANPSARVFVSNPTWPNHLSILEYLGQDIGSYRYFDSESRAVDFDGMLDDLRQARRGDVVLLLGCCHNPTGANLNLTQWQDVVAVLQETGAVPVIDIAYQGFGEGLEADAAGTRLVASSVPECLIAASCSKNFGIYRERTGILMVVSHDAKATSLSQQTLFFLNRQNYSFPPDHGARLVTMIWNDATLRAQWQTELEDTRLGMLDLRQQLADTLQRLSGSDQYGFLAQHRGMFSRLGIGPDMVERLRVKHGIYMLGDSRVNIAGLNAQTVPVLAEALVAEGI